MCGRYRLTAKERYLAEHFEIEDELNWAARYNVAPTQQVPIVRKDARRPGRRWSLVRWGLIPYWSKDAGMGAKTINAVAETAAEKPAFREPMKRQRCLVPADGFYEWQTLARRQKQPYSIAMEDGSVFAFAGLWDRWRTSSGDVVESCSILTTQANSLLAGIHHRMPVILRKEDYELWLDPAMTDPARVQGLLKPFDPELMKKYPVSTYVNSANNEGAECAREAADATSGPMAPTLF